MPHEMAARAGERRIVTVPNALSAIRILMIPVFVILLLGEHKMAGLLLLGLVASTDWVDGYVARRTNTVTEVGKVLDPVADRVALAAALITLIVIDAFPLWAALLILVRDALILVVGTALVAGRGIRIDVRLIGKVATFTIWCGVGLIAWGNLGFALDDAALVVGWTGFIVGTVEYYVATIAYVGDMRRELARRRT